MNTSERTSKTSEESTFEENLEAFSKLFQFQKSTIDDGESRRTESSLLSELEKKKVLSLAQDHNIHGQLLQSNGLYDEALSEFQKAIDILEPVFGNDSVEVSTLLVNMGVVHLSKRELEDAEEKFSAALSIRVRHLGELSFPVATVYAYLAEVYRIRGESEETLQCYEKTISILEELKNQIENTMKIQSEAIEQKIENELETNRNESMRSLLTPEEERIQSEIEQKYEEIKRELAKTYNNAGLVHFYEKNFEVAEKLFQISISLYEQLTDYHDDIKFAFKNLITLYKELHRQFLKTKQRISKFFFQKTPTERNTAAIQQAEAHCLKLLTIMENQYGDESIEIVFPLELLVDVLLLQDRYIDATKCLERMLKITVQKFGAMSEQALKVEDKLNQIREKCSFTQ